MLVQSSQAGCQQKGKISPSTSIPPFKPNLLSEIREMSSDMVFLKDFRTLPNQGPHLCPLHTYTYLRTATYTCLLPEDKLIKIRHLSWILVQQNHLKNNNETDLDKMMVSQEIIGNNLTIVTWTKVTPILTITGVFNPVIGQFACLKGENKSLSMWCHGVCHHEHGPQNQG